MKLFDDWYKWFCLQFFAQAGFPCPALRNPSDHFLRCINSDFDKVKATLKGSMKLRVFNFSSLSHKFVFQFHYTLYSFNILICAFHQLFSNIHTSANIWCEPFSVVWGKWWSFGQDHYCWSNQNSYWLLPHFSALLCCNTKSGWDIQSCKCFSMTTYWWKITKLKNDAIQCNILAHKHVYILFFLFIF